MLRLIPLRGKAVRCPDYELVPLGGQRLGRLEPGTVRLLRKLLTGAIEKTHCSAAQYETMYRRSLEDPDGFWAEQAERIDWVRRPTRIAGWS